MVLLSAKDCLNRAIAGLVCNILTEQLLCYEQVAKRIANIRFGYYNNKKNIKVQENFAT